MSQPLSGLKVLDISTLFAAPLAAMLLGDYGADVIKIEHPRGDASRAHGPMIGDRSLFWALYGRNKRAVTLNLSNPRGAEIFLRMVREADIVIENFRPGTLERWGLGYDKLAAENPALIMLRVTGFGQTGPYAHRTGFGTLAEAMSGFADMTGTPDGPPTLPPFGLADGITGFAAAFAVMTAVHSRATSGLGQIIDISLIEPIMTILGAQPTVYDQLGIISTRNGNRSKANAPRNTYRTSDGKWLAISTSSTSVAERLVTLVGGAHFVTQPWFKTAAGRVEHVDELDAIVAQWIAARTAAEVMAETERVEAACAPIYNIADIFEDAHIKAIDAITTVKDDMLGEVKMQNVIFRMSRDRGEIKFAGRALGSDNASVYAELIQADDKELADLKAAGAI